MNCTPSKKRKLNSCNDWTSSRCTPRNKGVEGILYETYFLEETSRGGSQEHAKCPCCGTLNKNSKSTWLAQKDQLQTNRRWSCACCEACQKRKHERERNCRRDSHILGYKFPGRFLFSTFSGFLQEELLNLPELKFEGRNLKAEELEGKYEVVFYTAPEGGRERFPRVFSRKTKGDLDISLREGELYGTVQMDKSVLHYIEPEGGQFRFRESHEDVDHSGKNFIRVQPEYMHETFGTGYLKVIGARVPLPRCPDYQIHLCEDLKFPYVQFESDDDAVKIQEHFENELSHPWLVTSMGLPDLVAARICQFLRPAPIFFFEKGDLVLKVSWVPEQRSTKCNLLASILVARRKQ